jgi:periplasmic protein CpxP/Spy
MKNSFWSILLVLVSGMILLQSFALAQPEGKPRPPKGGPMPPEEMIKELKKELNLTSDQEAKIKKIFESQKIEMDKMMDAVKKEREAIREKMEQQRKEIGAKISAILSEEQKKKYEELQKKHFRKMPPRDHGDGEEAPMPPPCPDHQE